MDFIKRVRQTFLPQRGFSLVQVMVGFALLGVLSMFMMGLFDQQNKLSSRAKMDADLAEMRSLFQSMLNNIAICEMNMAHSKGQDMDFFLLEAEEPFATINTRFKNSNLMVKRMHILSDAEVQSKTGEPAPPVSSSDGFTTITFRVEVQKLNKTLGGSDINLDFSVAVHMGEVVPKAGPSPSNVKAQCFADGFVVADSLYRHKPEYNDPGEEPLYCPASSPARCFGFCVKYSGPNMKVLYCGER